MKLIQFFALFLLLMVTGVFWGTWFSLSRSMEVFSVEEFIHIGKTIILNLALPMRIILPACIVFMTLSIWSYPKKSKSFYLTLCSLLFILLALVITLAIEVPIDNEIKVWTASTAPSDWQQIRDRWQLFHTLRTFSSMASFAFLAGAIV